MWSVTFFLSIWRTIEFTLAQDNDIAEEPGNALCSNPIIAADAKDFVDIMKLYINLSD